MPSNRPEDKTPKPLTPSSPSLTPLDTFLVELTGLVKELRAMAKQEMEDKAKRKSY